MAKKRQALVPVTGVEYLPPASKKERKSVVVDRELERIYSEHDVITVDTVLAEARNPESVLHPYFEWDNEKAAERYRVMQAYAMIMGSTFVAQLVSNGQVEPRRVTDSASVRRLVNVYRGEGFKMRNTVLADDDARQALVEAKKSVLRSWCKSTIDISELREIRQSILSQL